MQLKWVGPLPPGEEGRARKDDFFVFPAGVPRQCEVVGIGKIVAAGVQEGPR